MRSAVHGPSRAGIEPVGACARVIGSTGWRPAQRTPAAVGNREALVAS